MARRALPADAEPSTPAAPPARPRRGRRRGGVLAPLLVWIGVAVVGLGLWAVWVPLPQWWGSEPVVGSGRSWPTVADSPTPVLSPLAPTATPDAAALTRAIGAVAVPEGVTVSVAVLDATTGTPLVATNPTPQVPASSMKVLTSTVALEVLGADRRFETKVVSGAAGNLVLVGGGDPLLATTIADAAGGASLEGLAESTAQALKSAGTTSITLAYDDSLFVGPAWHPDWPETFKWSVAPITALKADQARLTPRIPGTGIIARDPDPSARAARAFADLLVARGIAVTAVARGAAPSGATLVAKQDSLPVVSIVGHLLRTSDNDATEALARHVSLASGQPASFAGNTATLTAQAQRLGLWSSGMQLRDASGISDQNRVSASALAGAIRLGVTEPRLRSLLTGLPVAGVSGTLTKRFTPPAAQPGRGVVRAKTGTIRGINTLTGYAVSTSGHGYAFCLTTAGGNPEEAKAWLDAVSSVLAT